jgi:tripartite-type tricarboxylate transporter receptor subunit TctC
MGIVAPEGTAEDRIARFSDATSEALRDKAVSEKLKESMMVPSGAGPDVFRAQIQGESRKLSALISQLKLSID